MTRRGGYCLVCILPFGRCSASKAQQGTPADCFSTWVYTKTGRICQPRSFRRSTSRFGRWYFGAASILTGKARTPHRCTRKLTCSRLWALYLGRPPTIKLTDVSVRRPDRNARSWDLRIFAAWVHLIDIAGQIGDKL